LNRPQESPNIATEPLSQTPVHYTATELLDRTRRLNPDVRAKSEMVNRESAQVELAHKEFRPDFNLGYMYQNTDRKFRDYYMFTFSVRLPNRGRQKAELAEAEQTQQRTKQELQAEIQRVLAEVQEQYVMVQTSEEQLKIYTDGLIPQANATKRSGRLPCGHSPKDLACPTLTWQKSVESTTFPFHQLDIGGGKRRGTKSNAPRCLRQRMTANTWISVSRPERFANI